MLTCTRASAALCTPPKFAWSGSVPAVVRELVPFLWIATCLRRNERWNCQTCLQAGRKGVSGLRVGLYATKAYYTCRLREEQLWTLRIPHSLPPSLSVIPCSPGPLLHQQLEDEIERVPETGAAAGCCKIVLTLLSGLVIILLFPFSLLYVVKVSPEAGVCGYTLS